MAESSTEKIVRLAGKGMPPWLSGGKGDAKGGDDEKKEKSPSDMTDGELKAAYKKASSKKKMPWDKGDAGEESSEAKALAAEMKKRKLS